MSKFNGVRVTLVNLARRAFSDISDTYLMYTVKAVTDKFYHKLFYDFTY